MESNNNIRFGTAGGTLFTIIFNLSRDDIFKTSILAAIAAAVSFTASLLLKELIRFIKRRVTKKSQ